VLRAQLDLAFKAPDLAQPAEPQAGNPALRSLGGIANEPPAHSL